MVVSKRASRIIIFHLLTRGLWSAKAVGGSGLPAIDGDRCAGEGFSATGAGVAVPGTGTATAGPVPVERATAWSLGGMAGGTKVCGVEEVSAPWADLSDDRQSYFAGLGWDEERWDSAPTDREVSYEPFHPQKVRVSVPPLEGIGFDELGRLLSAHVVMLREGTLVGDDEYPPRQYVPLREFLEEVRAGSTHHYLKYDPEDEGWKGSIEEGLGIGILGSLLDALEPLGLLPGKPCGMGGRPAGYGWTFWVGAANTSTGMHYDDDYFGFLYVTEGRKRIVMLPNDYRTAHYACETYIVNHSCWTGIDILTGPLPQHAVEFELGPGDGIVIPSLAWHAVQNLEPTVAFGMLLEEEDFC